MTGKFAKQPPTRMMKHDPICAVAGCDRKYYAKGCCRKHWERMWLNGTVETKISQSSDPVSVRLARYQERDGDCILWTAYRDKYGYGSLTIDGRTYAAHRVAWVEANGKEIPASLVVRHTCDRPPCINPEHLVLGTPADNSRDAVERRRNALGERNAGHKLKEEQVLEIYELAQRGTTHMALAERFSVGSSTIGRIARKESWKHLWRQHE